MVDSSSSTCWEYGSTRSRPVAKLTEDVVQGRYLFDGSRIRGWQPTCVGNDLHSPSRLGDHGSSTRADAVADLGTSSTRHQAAVQQGPAHHRSKAERVLKQDGIANSHFGPEPEFSSSRVVLRGTNRASYLVDSIGRRPRRKADRERGSDLGTSRQEGRYSRFADRYADDIRDEMAMTLEAGRHQVEVFHHEVANGGQWNCRV